MEVTWRKAGKVLLYIVGVWILIYLILLVVFRPSHDRDWELGHEKLPHIVYSTTSSLVTIENYRDFSWTAVNQAEARYVTKTFDLAKIDSVDVFISHFDDFEGLAHIFLSFGFVDDEQIVISLETRRELDESFSPLLGLLRQFEIIYVVGSEADIVGVRTGYRDERVYLYPTKANATQAGELFRELANDINAIYKKPLMYNTLTNNCTNKLTRPVERISDVRFPLTWKTVLPGYFDEILYKLGLIDTVGTFSEVKVNHLLDNTKLDTQSKTYSLDIRAELK
ncbi:DUF4105 domain-containing protein [Candidatus Kaiserbacteria bacterium]|nr:DUF4105 domain-containing protein [Candidatus Kaiserbacteria bacterium]NCT01698.1 DUF4105 domain-containing protein [Candidatus Parcubacteria bacterium]